MLWSLHPTPVPILFVVCAPPCWKFRRLLNLGSIPKQTYWQTIYIQQQATSISIEHGQASSQQMLIWANRHWNNFWIRTLSHSEHSVPYKMEHVRHSIRMYQMNRTYIGWRALKHENELDILYLAAALDAKSCRVLDGVTMVGSANLDTSSGFLHLW